jgi:1-pyrroline-5-carboxylate dehydrogenase
VYTRNPEKIERARREFFVGNLYINRKCTGAIVGAHPFGGFNMSGTDSKAGGHDYLLLFLQAKSIAEKLG